eukprot:9031041-Pyramimonas_sp.AAC.1
MPQRFQYPPRPKKQADPASKRSRQRLLRQLNEAASEPEPELPRPPMRARRQIRFKMPPPFQYLGAQNWGLESEGDPQQEDDG